MTEHTTIQVRDDQAQALKEIQGESGSYKTAIDSLLDAYTDMDTAGVDAEEIAGAIDLPDALSYEDVRAASEAGARAALDDYQR